MIFFSFRILGLLERILLVRDSRVRATPDFFFQLLPCSKSFSRKRDRERDRREEQQLETSFNRNTFPLYFRPIQPYPPDSCYPILILVHRSNRGYRGTQLFGSSGATVFCLPSNTPTAFHRDILIAINNCRRDKTTLARIYPPSSLSGRIFELIIAQKFGIFV